MCAPLEFISWLPHLVPYPYLIFISSQEFAKPRMELNIQFHFFSLFVLKAHSQTKTPNLGDPKAKLKRTYMYVRRLDRLCCSHMMLISIVTQRIQYYYSKLIQGNSGQTCHDVSALEQGLHQALPVCIISITEFQHLNT